MKFSGGFYIGGVECSDLTTDIYW